MPGFVPGYLVRDDNLEDFEDFETEKVRQQEVEKRKGCVAVKGIKNSEIEEVQEIAEKKVNETAAVKVMEGKTGDKKKAGKLMQLTVHGARNLPKKGMLRQINPYVVVAVDEQEARSTSVNSCNPNWDFVTTFDVEPNASQELSIVVFDKDVGYDDLIGETFLGVDDILMTLDVKDIKEAWLELDYCNNAQIQISTSMVDRDQGNSQGEVDNQLSRVKDEAESVRRAMEEAKASLQEKEAAAMRSKEEAALKMKEEAENARRAMEEAKAVLQEKVAAAKRAKEKATSRTKAGATLVIEAKQSERGQGDVNKTKQLETEVLKTVIDKDEEEPLKTRESMRKEWDDREASLKIIAEQKKRIMAETEAKALQSKQEESQIKSRVQMELPNKAEKTTKEEEAEDLELYRALKQAEEDKITKKEEHAATLQKEEEKVEIKKNEESASLAKEALIKEALKKHNEEQESLRKRRIEEEAKSEAEALELYKSLKKAEEDREAKSKVQAALKAKEAEAEKRALDEKEAKRRSKEKADEAAKTEESENVELRRKVKEEEEALRKIKIQREAKEEADALEIYRALKKEEEQKERKETEALKEDAEKRYRDEKEAERKAKDKAEDDIKAKEKEMLREETENRLRDEKEAERKANEKFEDDIKAKEKEAVKASAQESEDAKAAKKLTEAEEALGSVLVEEGKKATRNYGEEALAENGTQTQDSLKQHTQTTCDLKRASEDTIGSLNQEQCSSPAVRLPHYERASKASGPPGLEMVGVTTIKIIQPKAKTPPPAPKQQQCKKHTKCLCDQLGL